RGIGRNDLDQTLVEQLDVGGEPADTATRKTPQQRVFQQSRGILSGDFLGTELAANSEHLGHQFGLRTFPSGIPSFSASSSGVGSWPISLSSWREVRMILEIASTICTGMRMVRAWS